MMCWFTLGMGLVVYLPLKSMMHSWRDGRHACPNCGAYHLPHRACKACGMYNGRQVLKVEEEQK